MDQGLHQLAPVFRRDLRVVQRIDGGGGRVARGGEHGVVGLPAVERDLGLRDAPRASFSAADADIVNNSSGQLTFDGAATAGNARIGNSGFAAFRGNASAGNASITNNQSGRIEFSANADAGSNLLANSGTVTFAGASSAGTRFIANNIGGSVAFTGTGVSTFLAQTSASSHVACQSRSRPATSSALACGRCRIRQCAGLCLASLIASSSSGL